MFTNFLSKQNYHSSVLQKPKYFEWQMLSQKNICGYINIIVLYVFGFTDI